MSRQAIVAVCSVLTALALDDEAALQARLGWTWGWHTHRERRTACSRRHTRACCVHASQIRKANGVYLLGQLLLKAPRRGPDDPDAEAGGGEAAPLVGDASAGLLLRSSKRDHEDEGSASCGSSHESMAAHAFRTLRFVFSTERNRKLFRRLFPPDLYASFIDVGQYERDLQRRAQPASVSVAHPPTLHTNRRSLLFAVSRYTTLVRQLAALAPEARAKVQEALKDSASGQLNRSATFIFGAAGRNCASRVWQSTWRGGLPCATSRTTRCRNC